MRKSPFSAMLHKLGAQFEWCVDHGHGGAYPDGRGRVCDFLDSSLELEF